MGSTRTGLRTARARLGVLAAAFVAVVLGATAGGVVPAAADTAVVLPSPTITSAVFPESPAPGPVIRTYGTFTFTVPTPTDVTGFYYVLDGTLSVGGGSPYVKAKNGAATTPPLASAEWGTNTLTVQSVDAAGGVSQPSTYQFYLVAGYPADGFADLNGDGHIDLLSVSAAGGLLFSAGTGDGHLAKPVATGTGIDFTGALVAAAGDYNHDEFQDLAAFRQGYLYIYDNDGFGGFKPSQSVSVLPPSGLSAWPTLTQLFAAGPITSANHSDLVAVWGGQAYFLPNTFANRFGTPVAIGGTAWAGLTLLGVVDGNGDGIADLIARDDVTGAVWLYPGAGGGSFGDGTNRVQIGSGLKAAKFPHAVIKGDVTGDGLLDIWATGANGGLRLLQGVVGGGFAAPVKAAGGTAWKGVTAIG